MPRIPSGPAGPSSPTGAGSGGGIYGRLANHIYAGSDLLGTAVNKKIKQKAPTSNNPVRPSYHGGGNSTPQVQRSAPHQAVAATTAEKPGPAVNPALAQQKWLAGDPTYLQMIADINKGLSDYNSQQTMNINNYQQDQTKQVGDFENQRKQALDSMLNDYSARGLDTSSLYSDAQQQYNTQADAQKQSILDAIARQIQGAQTGMTQQSAQADLEKKNALQQAIRRYQDSLPSV